MRIHKREEWVPLAKTELNLELHKYVEKEDLNSATVQQRIYRLLSLMAANRRPGRETPKIMNTKLSTLVYTYQEEHELTDIEVMQALTDFCESSLKYDLRWERHKNYEKPAGMA